MANTNGSLMHLKLKQQIFGLKMQLLQELQRPNEDCIPFHIPTPGSAGQISEQDWIRQLTTEIEASEGDDFSDYQAVEERKRGKRQAILGHGPLLHWIAQCLYACIQEMTVRNHQAFAAAKRETIKTLSKSLLEHVRQLETGYALTGNTAAASYLQQQQKHISLFRDRLAEITKFHSHDFTAKRQGRNEANFVLAYCAIGLQAAMGAKGIDYGLLTTLLNCAYRAAGQEREIDCETVKRRILRFRQNMPEFWEKAEKYISSFKPQ